MKNKKGSKNVTQMVKNFFTDSMYQKSNNYINLSVRNNKVGDAVVT